MCVQMHVRVCMCDVVKIRLDKADVATSKRNKQ